MGDLIQLFPHNQTAYYEACKWLARAGRAAIVHPTGTGKSFIAFKLCEDRPSERICWLSPSVYIWKTQLENVKAVSGWLPENVTFLTYAKLMLLTEDERAALRPTLIILDEFHRCGAEEWGKGVQALLKDYPQAQVLGLTATPIRYLDQQRDMVAELFDGCVAHEMSLSEAIVLGVLPAPKYVLTLYAFEQECERYQRRICKTGGAAGKQAEILLSKLRRRLEEADGICRIFERHMPDHKGKYLVFCSDRAHMEKLLSCVPAWFGAVDPAPHIYQVYAENTQAKEVFSCFKADESEHLKVLFCIDMLNEGIHVDGLAGVILCRTTVSPIVYKQQIGRALSAAAGTPVIFDLVNNVENLYSISALRKEMDEMMTFYANEKKHDALYQGFELIDEVRDCRELFEQLEETLCASWDMMYAEAAAYYHENGHLHVPKAYRTDHGLDLGNWIQTQRRVRSGARPGMLTKSQIERLDVIGMQWKNSREQSWDNGLAHAKAYRQAYGNLDVKSRFVCEDGFALGMWISRMRMLKAGTNHRSHLSEGQQKQLDELGMVWSKQDLGFERGFDAAVQYFVQNGHLNVPCQYETREGFKLGAWLSSLRKRRNRLSLEQQQQLDRLHMNWDGRNQSQWKKAYQEALRYYQQHGNIDVPLAYEADGIYLARWLRYQKEQMERGKLTQEQLQCLERLGFVSERKNGWEQRFQEARQYYQTNGHLNVPANYITDKGTWLNKWLSVQRKAYQTDKLLPEQRTALESIGMQWSRPMPHVQRR